MAASYGVAWRCHNCGQGWKLEQTDEFNLKQPNFCPICGTPSLERAKTVMGTQEARCFTRNQHFKQLAELLKFDWHFNPEKLSPSPRETYPVFLDYLNARIQEG